MRTESAAEPGMRERGDRHDNDNVDVLVYEEARCAGQDVSYAPVWDGMRARCRSARVA